MLFALYLIGNFQSFTDKTQLRILGVLGVAAAVLSVLSFLGIVQEIVFIFLKSRKTPAFFMILFFIFSLITGLALISFAILIRRISMGI